MQSLKATLRTHLSDIVFFGAGEVLGPGFQLNGSASTSATKANQKHPNLRSTRDGRGATQVDRHRRCK